MLITILTLPRSGILEVILAIVIGILITLAVREILMIVLALKMSREEKTRQDRG